MLLALLLRLRLPVPPPPREVAAVPEGRRSHSGERRWVISRAEQARAIVVVTAAVAAVAAVVAVVANAAGTAVEGI